MGGLVGYAVDHAIATITLDSPTNRNALSGALVAQLRAALATASADEAVHAIVLTHTGSTFCAGNDLRESATKQGSHDGTTRLVALLRAIVELPKPVIARVDGHVRAGGVGLVCACDVAFGGPRTTFAFPETRLGLAPAILSLTTLGQMSARAASRYLLTGEVLDGPAAAATGLLSEHATDVDAVLGPVLEALRVASPRALAETKAITTAAVRADFDDRAAAMLRVSADLFDSADAREGMQAFLEKRPPRWRNPSDG